MGGGQAEGVAAVEDSFVGECEGRGQTVTTMRCLHCLQLFRLAAGWELFGRPALRNARDVGTDGR